MGSNMNIDGLHFAFSSYNTNETCGSLIPCNRFRHLSLSDQRKSLPIYQYVTELLWGVKTSQNLIIYGETGSGKSTQIPQYLFEAGWCSYRSKIILTVANTWTAVSIAKRIADEMKTVIGNKVGYSTFEGSVMSAQTVIVVVTDAMLLRMIQKNPLLITIKVLIIDDCHQRRKEADLILGLMKKIHRKRPYLRLLLLSSTADIEMLLAYYLKKSSKVDEEANSGYSKKHIKHNNDKNKFNATLNLVRYLKIEESHYPLNIYYLDHPCLDYVKATFQTTVHRKHNVSYSVIAFLTNKEEVDCVSELLKNEIENDRKSQNIDVFSLYHGSVAEKQISIYKKPRNGYRKVILATTSVESSLNIVDVNIIIDCGFVKLQFLDYKTDITFSTVVPCSKSSASQRSQHACKFSEGYCYRLYPETALQNLMLDYTVPEISRTNLSQILLYLLLIGINNFVDQIDLPSPVTTESVKESLHELYALQAINSSGELTEDLGVKMAELPFDPKLSRFLLLSSKDEFKCSHEAIIICSMIKSGNPWIDPVNKSKLKYDILQANMRSIGVNEGDFVTLYNVYQQSLFHKNEDSGWDTRHMVSTKIIKKATKIKKQLEFFFERYKIPIISCGTNVTSLCQAISAGLFLNAAFRLRDGSYKLCRDIENPSQSYKDVSLTIHPFSLANPKQPTCIVYLDAVAVVDTANFTSSNIIKGYMTGITRIHPRWLKEFSNHYFYIDHSESN